MGVFLSGGPEEGRPKGLEVGNREGGAFLGAFPCGKQVEGEVVRVPSEPVDRLGTPSTPAES